MAGIGEDQLRPGSAPLLTVRNLCVDYSIRRREVLRAVSGVSFDVCKGETLGLVGESGCGKSTSARAVVQMPKPTGGSVVFRETELTTLAGARLRRLRREIQVIYQDPVASLNPRRNVFDVVRDPLDVWRIGSKSERQERVDRALLEVGLDPDAARRRYPTQYSGGQCQRIAIARSLIAEPSVLICDEPVSALDVSIQAQVLNLLEDVRRRRELTMVFVSHDLSVVRSVSDRVAVMYLGRLCEIGPASSVYSVPRHPYTAALLAAAPRPTAESRRARPVPLAGELPSPLDPPEGCRFRTRCARAERRCEQAVPEMRQLGDDHFAACHFPLEASK